MSEHEVGLDTPTPFLDKIHAGDCPDMAWESGAATILHRRSSLVASACLAAALLSGTTGFAQDDASGPTDASAIAAELSNPVGSLAQLTFKNQYRFYEGDLPGADDQSNYTLLFQPVFPFLEGVS